MRACGEEFGPHVTSLGSHMDLNTSGHGDVWLTAMSDTMRWCEEDATTCHIGELDIYTHISHLFFYKSTYDASHLQVKHEKIAKALYQFPRIGICILPDRIVKL